MKPRLLTCAALFSVFTVGGFSQTDNTAYVQVVVNVNATVTITPPAGSSGVGATADAAADELTFLALTLSQVSTSASHGARALPNSAAGYRNGRLSLGLHPQQFANAQISLFSVNGKLVLRGKASASNAGETNLSRPNIAEGVYLLSVKGVNGNSLTTKVVHSGGRLDVNVAFGGQDPSLAKRTDAIDAWTINASAKAAGYADTSYPFTPVAGMNAIQIITLRAATTQDTEYTLTVNRNPADGGAAGTMPNGTSFSAGTTVTLTATPISGYTFKNWTAASAGVTFADANNPTTTFTMPADAVTVTANFEATAIIPPTGGDTFIDTRDGKVYKKVTIGTQTWMAENLNYDTAGSWCYGEGGWDEASNKTLSDAEVQANCDKYGRLYTWEAAMAACPVGWHLPTRAEWTTLVNYVGGSSTAGTQLKAGSPDWNGTDDHGFSALPGGYRGLGGSFYGLGSYGNWWTATEIDATFAYRRDVFTGITLVGESNGYKSFGFSARCLQD